MRGKVKESLDKKLNSIQNNYKACVECVLPPLKAIPLTLRRDEAIEYFKTASLYQKCKVSYFQNKELPVVEYINLKHQENVEMAAVLLEYKPWLSSETISQIEKIRCSDLPIVIIALTQSIGKELLDNEESRVMLGGMVFDLWT